MAPQFYRPGYGAGKMRRDHGAGEAFAGVVVRDRHHRRHLGLPFDVHRVVRQLADGAVVVLALDVVEEVQAVTEDQVLRDTGPAYGRQHVGPDLPVVLLVALDGAGLEARVDADLHGWESGLSPDATWERTQRSPLAMCAVAAARASSGSPPMTAS